MVHGTIKSYQTVGHNSENLSSLEPYLRARRPDLYDKLVEPLSEDMEQGTHPGWQFAEPKEE